MPPCKILAPLIKSYPHPPEVLITKCRRIVPAAWPGLRGSSTAQRGLCHAGQRGLGMPHRHSSGTDPRAGMASTPIPGWNQEGTTPPPPSPWAPKAVSSSWSPDREKTMMNARDARACPKGTRFPHFRNLQTVVSVPRAHSQLNHSSAMP